MTQEKQWRDISRNCLKNHSVPLPLQALWREKQSGTNFLSDWHFGDAKLIDFYPDDIFHGYTAEFIGSQRDSDAWRKMFDEIGIFAIERDGGLIGLWFHSKYVDSESAPVVQIDSEGQLMILSRNITDYPAAKAWWNTEGRDFDDAYQLVVEWSIKYKLTDLIEVDELDAKISGFPDPEKRFQEYYDAL